MTIKKHRNNLVELARFLFSLLVIGYHVQMTWAGGGVQFFAVGALAVEFFFLISGFFFARSVEKITAQEHVRILKEAKGFMWGKIKGILPIHIVAICLMIIVLLLTRQQESGTLIVQGIPSMFLVQTAAVWNDSYQQALIVPEWYLSAMLLTMLILFTLSLVLKKKTKGATYVVFLLVLMLPIILAGMILAKGAFPKNLEQNMRAWGEMCVGMFACYFSAHLKRINLNNRAIKALPVLEIILYCIPIIMGIIPISPDAMPVTMIVSVVCVFFAIAITFSGKGLQIRNHKANEAFGFLGGLSLPVYLLHPVLISLFEYTGIQMPLWGWHLLIFPLSIGIALLYHLISRHRQ